MAALTSPLSCRLGSTGLPVPSNSTAPQEHSVLPPSCFSWLQILARGTTVPKPGAGDSLLFFRPPTSGYCWSVSVLPPTPAARGLPPAAALAQGLMVCLDRNFSRTAPGSVIQCSQSSHIKPSHGCPGRPLCEPFGGSPPLTGYSPASSAQYGRYSVAGCSV